MKKIFIYFLCLSFLLMTGHVHWIIAEAKDKTLPIAEMVSKGSVKFEVRDNVWKPVESSHFPIFKETRIKTESGHALLTFSDNGRIEVSPKSLFSFDKEGRLVLKEGSLKFHLPMTSDLNFKIGNLSVVKARSLQVARGSTAFPSFESIAAGVIIYHPNGSVTVTTTEGKLNVLSPDNAVLAAIPKNESVTIPSVTVSGPQRVMVAQAGETAAATTGTTGTFLGISTWGWVGIIAGAALVAGVSIAAAQDDDDDLPICP